MDKDPLLSLTQELQMPSGSPHELYQAALLLLLAHDKTDVRPHSPTAVKVNGRQEFARNNDIHRSFDASISHQPGLESIQSVDLRYIAPHMSAKKNPHEESVIMTVRALDTEDRTVKMYMEDPATSEEIAITNTGRHADGRFETHDATADDLKYVAAIVQALKALDT